MSNYVNSATLWEGYVVTNALGETTESIKLLSNGRVTLWINAASDATVAVQGQIFGDNWDTFLTFDIDANDVYGIPLELTVPELRVVVTPLVVPCATSIAVHSSPVSFSRS